jgi:hypothetical protein
VLHEVDPLADQAGGGINPAQSAINSSISASVKPRKRRFSSSFMMAPQ